jgi:hypothetical protein
MGRTLDDALAYAERQREDLPQIVQVVPHDYDRILMAEEIARLRSLVETAGVIFRHNLTPDKGFNYFICGEGGSKDTNGLPEKLYLSPAYGCDWFQVYDRTDVTAGSEW